MIEVAIPGYKELKLKYLVLDFNGTLSCDGKLLEGVKERLEALSEDLEIHVLTADTFGRAQAQLEGIPCELFVLPLKGQDRGKLEYIERLGSKLTVCVGNGRNDRLMIEGAALGIAVVLDEGAAVETLMAADVVCSSIFSALDLLSNPLRLVATLRS